MGCNQAEQQVDRQNRQKRVTFELNSLIPMERKKKSEETESQPWWAEYSCTRSLLVQVVPLKKWHNQSFLSREILHCNLPGVIRKTVSWKALEVNNQSKQDNSKSYDETVLNEKWKQKKQ